MERFLDDMDATGERLYAVSLPRGVSFTTEPVVSFNDYVAGQLQASVSRFGPFFSPNPPARLVLAVARVPFLAPRAGGPRYDTRFSNMSAQFLEALRTERLRLHAEAHGAFAAVFRKHSRPGVEITDTISKKERRSLLQRKPHGTTLTQDAHVVFDPLSSAVVVRGLLVTAVRVSPSAKKFQRYVRDILMARFRSMEKNAADLSALYLTDSIRAAHEDVTSVLAVRRD